MSVITILLLVAAIASLVGVVRSRGTDVAADVSLAATVIALIKLGFFS